MTTLKHAIGKVVLPRLPLNRRTFDVLRFELNAVVTTALNHVHPGYIGARRRLRRQRALSVNLGSGGTGRAGWVNVDVRRHHRDVTLAHDIRRGLPFADGQVARLMAEHVVEHIEFRHDVPRLMAEFFRVLEPGGWLRIAVPDTERWLDAYISRDPAKWAALGFPRLPDDMPTPMAMINHVFHQDGEHQFAYDFETLDYLLSRAGFVDVTRMAHGQSNDPGLAGLDQPGHASYSLYVEARKPGAPSD